MRIALFTLAAIAGALTALLVLNLLPDAHESGDYAFIVEGADDSWVVDYRLTEEDCLQRLESYRMLEPALVYCSRFN